MQLKSRLLPVAAIVATALAAGPVLAQDGDGDSQRDDVPPPHAVQTVYLEAEDLLPALESYEAPGERQPGVAIASRQEVDDVFSGNAGVLLTNGDDGTRLTLRFTVPASGAYSVAARMGVGPDLGIVQPAIDGRPLGRSFDAYATEAGRSDELVLSRVELAKGDHTVTFTVESKNAAATGKNARVDYLTLDP
ncbi:MAG: hypothetical protein H0U79_02370 [Solirubrobacterales bacterium]|nr:hypothetical protein [Solirubrobacterales bacterium]